MNIPNYIVNISSTSQIKDYNEYNNYFNTNVNNVKADTENNEEILHVSYQEILDKEKDLSKIITYVEKKYIKKDFILLNKLQLNKKIINHYNVSRSYIKQI